MVWCVSQLRIFRSLAPESRFDFEPRIWEQGFNWLNMISVKDCSSKFRGLLLQLEELSVEKTEHGHRHKLARFPSV